MLEQDADFQVYHLKRAWKAAESARLRKFIGGHYANQSQFMKGSFAALHQTKLLESKLAEIPAADDPENLKEHVSHCFRYTTQHTLTNAFV
jgi:hypothetical protein